MSVYIDPLMGCIPNKNWKWNKSCHLWTESEDLEILHAFAKRIGLRRSWFQAELHKAEDIRIQHYDLTETRRLIAVKAGAIELNRREAVDSWNRVRAKATERMKERDRITMLRPELEGAFPVEWHDPAIMGDRFILDDKLFMAWVTLHFQFKSPEEAVKRLTLVDPLRELCIIDSKSYRIPGLCFIEIIPGGYR